MAKSPRKRAIEHLRTHYSNIRVYSCRKMGSGPGYSIILQAESIHADKVAHIANLFQGQAGEIIPDYDVDVTGHSDPFLAFEILHATLPEGDSQ